MLARKIFIIMFILSASANAETDTRTNAWFMSLSRFQLTEHFRAFLDIQPRFTIEDTEGGDNGSIDTLLLRGAFGYQISPDVGIYQGYAFIPTYDPDQVEHRSFQELLVRQFYSRGTVMHRVRFEQRFLEGVDDTAYRVRYFARFTYPLNQIHEKLSLAINEEVFIHINDNDRGPQSGFNQNRLFIGLNYRVSRALALEAGYQNKYLNGQGGADNVMNHILFLGFLTNF